MPTWPDAGEKPEIVGANVVTVNLPLLVAVPLAVVMVIGPVIAPTGTVAVSDVGEDITTDTEAVPLNFTVAPVKLVPVIVTTVPTGPDAGVNAVIVGAGTPRRVSVADVAEVSVSVDVTA